MKSEYYIRSTSGEVERETPEVFVYKYNNFKRFIIFIIYLFMSIAGLSLMLIENWLTIILGIVIMTIGLFRAVDILLFKQLIFSENDFVKEWYIFGKRSILLLNLSATAVKRVWSGVIFFEDKDSSFVTRLIMSFETFPIGNDGFRKIKAILIQKKIITGDENEWNY